MKFGWKLRLGGGGLGGGLGEGWSMGKRRWLWRGSVALVLGLTLAGVGGRAEILERDNPYTVRAAILLAFLRYVEWPEEAFSSPEEPFRVGVLERDPFGEILDETMAGRMANGRGIEVVRIRKPEDIGQGVHLLYVPNWVEWPQEGYAEKLEGPVLVVGETLEAWKEYATIVLLERRSRVVFQVDLGRAEAAGFRMGSPMLKSAAEVRKPERREG